MSADLASLVLSYVDEPLVLTPEDVNAEARDNMMTFGFVPTDLNSGSVERALLAVGQRLGERFADVSGPVTFYAWYDEQAGQLRCSLASVSPDALPFGGPFRPVGVPGQVLARMVADQSPGSVVWEDLEAGSDEEAVEASGEDRYWFPVFAVDVAASGHLAGP